MRRAATLVLVLVLPTAAGAQEVTHSSADVLFKDTVQLFRGDEVSAQFPQAGIVRLKLGANITERMDVALAGKSDLYWPQTLTQTWHGVANGGELTLWADFILSADILFDGTDWGFPSLQFTYKLWDDTWTWDATSTFDSLLLPGSPTEQAVLVVAPDSLWDYAFNVASFDVAGYTFSADVWGDIEPNVRATVTGQKIVTGTAEFATATATATLAAPGSNLGSMNLASRWEGLVESTFGIDFSTNLTVNMLDTATGTPSFSTNLPYTYTWTMATDVSPAVTKPSAYTHPLPAINLGSTLLSFGEVNVNETSKLTVTVNNLGDITLKGAASFDGDGAFGITQPDISATRTAPDTIEVAFAPTASGDFTGTVTVATNDPVRPTLTVAVTGTGVGGPGDTGTDTNDLGNAQGCNCSASGVGAANSAGVLGLLSLLGFLGARRRQA